jgi:hypothetical protein
MSEDPYNAFRHRHGGWGAPHQSAQETPWGSGRQPERDPDLGCAAGRLEGDFQHRRHDTGDADRGFAEWLHHRRREEFEAWRANTTAEQKHVAPPQAVMSHNPVDAQQGDGTGPDPQH